MDDSNHKLPPSPVHENIPSESRPPEHNYGRARSKPPIESKEMMDVALHFLSTSSNQTLACTLFALMGATYIILGRVGLILIGIASGVVLHASWEGIDRESVTSPSNKRKKRRELALDLANRLVDWPGRDIGGRELSLNSNVPQNNPEDVHFDFIDFRPQTAAALRSLTNAVIQDYVNYWYQPILPSDTNFAFSCRKVLSGFITSVSSHLCRKRAADAFLEFLTNSSSMIIVFLNELSTAFEGSGPLESAEKTVQQYLDLYPESSLASVLAEEQQRKKLSMIADDVLSSFLDSKTYDCPPAREFLREILAGVVLESTISSLSRPEFLNGWIIHLFSEGESEIMSAIDAGVEGSRNQGVSGAEDVTDDIKEKKTSKDRATEEAMVEAKRLSALIAAQDIKGPNRPHPQHNDSQNSPAVFVEDGITPSSNDMTDNPDDKPNRRRELEQPDTGTNEDFHSNVEIPCNGDANELSLPMPKSSDSTILYETSSEQVSEPPLTLHHASISVDDGSEPGGKGLIRSKPTSSYLLQIEPESGRRTGWMVFRKYSEFELLHEALETISRLNRIENFVSNHPALPCWKGQTNQGLARGLEKYLRDALRYESLSESARMRWFLEKDGSLDSRPASSARSGFSFPSQVVFENMGKGVLGVLTNAPKGVSDGSKAVFDGVTGVFGAGTGRKSSMSSNMIANAPKYNENSADHSASIQTSEDGENAARRAVSLDYHKELKDDLQLHQTDLRYASSPLGPGFKTFGDASHDNSQTPDTPNSVSDSDTQNKVSAEASEAASEDDIRTGRNSPITQEETRIAVELIFAVINELYTLSSAWNFRRTLLNAAKTYILRPGNPNLETIRGLLQESMIKSNTSDENIAFYLMKLRENVLPTEAELISWPPPVDDVEQEHLRQTARKLLVQRGLPQALTSVMGAAASREALEKVFDCLQIQRIARGFVFSVLLQALRAVVL